MRFTKIAPAKVILLSVFLTMTVVSFQNCSARQFDGLRVSSIATADTCKSNRSADDCREIQEINHLCQVEVYPAAAKIGDTLMAFSHTRSIASISYSCAGGLDNQSTNNLSYLNGPNVLAATTDQHVGNSECNFIGTTIEGNEIGCGSAKLTISCENGYVPSSNGRCAPVVCEPGQITACSIGEHGIGQRSCNPDGAGYGSCQIIACKEGYELLDGSCKQTAPPPPTSAPLVCNPQDVGAVAMLVSAYCADGKYVWNSASYGQVTINSSSAQDGIITLSSSNATLKNAAVLTVYGRTLPATITNWGGVTYRCHADGSWRIHGTGVISARGQLPNNGVECMPPNVEAP